MISKKAKKWHKNNKWFNKNKTLTLLAIYFHEQLVDIDVDPKTDEYYNIIDLFMKPFLEKKVILKSKPKQRKTVRLTKSQKEIAEKLGVPLLEYTTNNLNSVEWL